MMPYRALTVTSTTNFHALGNYAGLAILGLMYFLNPKIQALDELLGAHFASLIMGTMMMSGIMAFTVAIVAKKRRDPSTSLWLEAILMWILGLLLCFIVAAVMFKYGPVMAMTTTILLGSWTFGCLGRGVQASRELHKLNKIRKLPVETVEVPAEPDGR